MMKLEIDLERDTFGELLDAISSIKMAIHRRKDRRAKIMDEIHTKVAEHNRLDLDLLKAGTALREKLRQEKQINNLKGNPLD